jgi:hypothetical protein
MQEVPNIEMHLLVVDDVCDIDPRDLGDARWGLLSECQRFHDTRQSPCGVLRDANEACETPTERGFIQTPSFPTVPAEEPAIEKDTDVTHERLGIGRQ